MSFPANSEIVAIAWLRLALPSYGVATTLPTADASMRTGGFVQVRGVGGSPEMYLPVRRPVVSASCWAAPATEASNKAPWGRANTLAERVLAATYDEALMDVMLDLSSFGDYDGARVLTVVALSEAVRVENDPANFARYDVDLALTWVSA